MSHIGRDPHRLSSPTPISAQDHLKIKPYECCPNVSWTPAGHGAVTASLRSLFKCLTTLCEEHFPHIQPHPPLPQLHAIRSVLSQSPESRAQRLSLCSPSWGSCRPPLSVFFPRLNKTSDLSCSSYDFPLDFHHLCLPLDTLIVLYPYVIAPKTARSTRGEAGSTVGQSLPSTG